MDFKGERAYRRYEIGEWCREAADALKVELKQLELDSGELPVDVFDVGFGDVTSYKPLIGPLLPQAFQTDTLYEVHNDERAETERVVGGSTPALDLGYGDVSLLTDAHERLDLHSNLLIRQVITDDALLGEADEPDVPVGEGQLLAQVVAAIDELDGAIRGAGKPVFMVCRNPTGQFSTLTHRSDLADPAISPNFMENIVTFVKVHNGIGMKVQEDAR